VGSAVKALRAAGQDKLGSAIWIPYNFVIPQPQYGPPLTLQERRPPAIICGRVNVLSAIQFDRQLCFAAGEVDNVRIDHELASEARTILPKSNP
jgi:hypothetical protein